MEQLIMHACGHEQTHHLVGYTSQQERKARWLRTTHCRSCFIERKKAAQAEAALRADAAIAHLDLPELIGSDRQIGWATTIRASRLAGLLADSGIDSGWQACLPITDAKWWIDHRDVGDADLLGKAAATGTVTMVNASPPNSQAA